jgi:hypothetical protein
MKKYILILCILVFSLSVLSPVSATFIKFDKGAIGSDFESKSNTDYNKPNPIDWDFASEAVWDDSFNHGYRVIGKNFPINIYPRIQVISGNARQGINFINMTVYPGDYGGDHKEGDKKDRVTLENYFDEPGTNLNVANDPNLWYGFSIRIPTTTILESRTNWIMIGSFMTRGANLALSGGLSLSYEGHGGIDVKTFDDNLSSPNGKQNMTTMIKQSDVEKGVWYDFKINIKWSEKNNGFVKIYYKLSNSKTWILGFSKTNYKTNRNTVDDAYNGAMYWQMGPYRDNTSSSDTTDMSKSVKISQSLHFDNVHLTTTESEIDNTFGYTSLYTPPTPTPSPTYTYTPTPTPSPTYTYTPTPTTSKPTPIFTSITTPKPTANNMYFYGALGLILITGTYILTKKNRR